MTNQHDHTLKRLLGPAGEEIGCDECFEKLDEFVDLELGDGRPEQAVPGMREHLEGCPACHEEYEGLRELVQSKDA